MKRLLTFGALLLTCIVSAQEPTPPRFRGADVNYFMSCLIAETEKIAIEEEISCTELSPRVGVGFTVDSVGRVSGWRFLDNTCEGRDHCELEPATAATRDAVSRAFERLRGEWTPAQSEGRATDYPLRMTLRIPVEKIEWKQNPDPLLFMGQSPSRSFRPWVMERLRYRQSQAGRGQEGEVKILFYVEPDGSITIGEVSAPDARLAREVVRVIRRSKGKWTPRKVGGVAQRTDCNFSVNFNGSN